MTAKRGLVALCALAVLGVGHISRAEPVVQPIPESWYFSQIQRGDPRPVGPFATAVQCETVRQYLQERVGRQATPGSLVYTECTKQRD